MVAFDLRVGKPSGRVPIGCQWTDGPRAIVRSLATVTDTYSAVYCYNDFPNLQYTSPSVEILGRDRLDNLPSLVKHLENFLRLQANLSVM